MGKSFSDFPDRQAVQRMSNKVASSVGSKTKKKQINLYHTRWPGRRTCHEKDFFSFLETKDEAKLSTADRVVLGGAARTNRRKLFWSSQSSESRKGKTPGGEGNQLTKPLQ